MLRKKSSVKKILRIACITGLVLSAAISIPLLIISLMHARENIQSKQTSIARSNPFLENIQEFDKILAANTASPPLNRLDAILNTAEEYAVSVESHISLLKRRRILAKEIPEYRIQYKNAVDRSFEKFPYSESVSIIAGDALLLQKSKLDNNDKSSLSTYVKNISAKNPIVLLGFHLFEGSARNVSTAKNISQAAEIFISAIDHVGNTEQPALISSAAMIQILAGNQNGAVNLINKYRTKLLEQSESAWFMVEALYDFDNPAVTASVLGTENYPYANNQSIIRLSDALYRTGNIYDARFFWNLLTFPDEDHASAPQSILEKALYNLAKTSQTEDEKQSYLEELLQISPHHVPGLILFSRMLNHEASISLLQNSLSNKSDALVELELVRQNRGYSEPGKTAADTWLLLGRYPKNPDVYEWASYFFQEMRMFYEASQLEKIAGYNNVSGSRLALQKALDVIRSGDLNQAEQLLKSIPPESGWEVSANLGLIKEKQLSITEAVEYYETASSFCRNNKDQALIQINIARCFHALGNSAEAVRILNYALDLDPDNLRVRLELRKLREL